ncbi:hypothetical protein VTI28DRAFT_6453 [Corynascus sepedonium]
MANNEQIGSLISALARTENVVYRLIIQTTYGLIIEATPEGGIDVRLSDKVASKRADSTLETAQPGYRYYIWPDYKTSFFWYEMDWIGNPGDETHVSQDDLRERYGEAWEKARHEEPIFTSE